jgi:hypothetical protein
MVDGYRLPCGTHNPRPFRIQIAPIVARSPFGARFYRSQDLSTSPHSKFGLGFGEIGSVPPAKEQEEPGRPGKVLKAALHNPIKVGAPTNYLCTAPDSLLPWRVSWQEGQEGDMS